MSRPPSKEVVRTIRQWTQLESLPMSVTEGVDNPTWEVEWGMLKGYRKAMEHVAAILETDELPPMT